MGMCSSRVVYSNHQAREELVQARRKVGEELVQARRKVGISRMKILERMALTE
jgi:hypothetical protein